jgi:hypothetical protein
MLTHAAPQLTPAQLIDAGRRAEAQGRPDMAVQFYRYLTDYFAEAVEAAEAHNALGRIGAAQALPLIARPGPVRTVAAAAPVARRRLTFRRDPYRTGRALTALLGAIGWLVTMAGTAAVPVFLLLRPAPADPLPAEVLPVAGGAAGGVILGCGVIVASHIARALFDQANAVHRLLALEHERRKAG